MNDNNGWPSKPGVPMNPDMREKLEYALAIYFSNNRMPHMSGDPRNRLSSLQRRNMEDAVTSILEVIGPALTPAEVDARVQQAKREALEEAAREIDCAMRELFGDADEYKQGWNAGLEAGAVAIRALKGEGDD